ncbi:TerD family protein [Streptomyces sp. CBMA29]|uniref:TerD family protein n=1 Tax=Streptomyces sp. CBMA29 TaxID=1896314 RepID=UPI00166217EA|nr:TerD family protein [Streptomyces sp. CBMA29]MBD0737168.1 stress response protein TerZ [Streptomyces sp. CBMA29]
MVKGGNVGLSALSEHAGAVIVSLGWSSASGDGDADVSVLLLDGDGKVRSDDDFYFYNNPAAADGSVQLLGKIPTESGSEDRISLDLTAAAGDVQRIVLAASRYGGARFGDLDDLRLTLADRNGEGLLRFTIEDAGPIGAVIFGELYRRDGGWKFRAVGQGYDSGLAGLATDFGIDVDDADESAADEEPGGALEAAPEPPVPPDASARVAVQGPAHAQGPVGTSAPIPRQVAPRATAPQAAPSVEQAPPPKRPRTARKKVTLPAVTRKSLAENDSWRMARLFPAGTLKSDRERETRATSVLLSVMAQVPEFGRRLTAAFGAPAGRMETYTEVSLPHGGESPKRPDGLIRVERAGKLWTALVETKTNGNPLRTAQVQDYVDIAGRRAYEAVITLSNDVALDGSPLVDVKIDGRRKHKVALWHLSWAEVTHQAQMLIRHEGVGNAAHAWLLRELLYYLQHENSGCHGFQNMGPAWVPVRRGIDEETLCEGDPRAVDVVANWERLIRQVCLRLGGELGQKVLPVQRVKRGTDPGERRAALADRLCREGRLQAELRIEDSPGVLGLTADLRTSKLRTSLDVPAPAAGSPLTWAKRLVRQLPDAPADLHVETLVDGRGSGPRGTLERLRPEPADLLPRDGATITGFRLSLFKGMGSTRGTAETGFIRSVDEAVDRFHDTVVTPLQRGPRG